MPVSPYKELSLAERILVLEDDPFGLGPERKRYVPLPPLGKDERKGRIGDEVPADELADLLEGLPVSEG